MDDKFIDGKNSFTIKIRININGFVMDSKMPQLLKRLRLAGLKLVRYNVQNPCGEITLV